LKSSIIFVKRNKEVFFSVSKTRKVFKTFLKKISRIEKFYYLCPTKQREDLSSFVKFFESFSSEKKDTAAYGR